MRTKLGVVVASLALTVGTTAILTAGPAEAGTVTKATLTINNGHHKAKGQYGNFIGFMVGGVTDGAGNPVDEGRADLQRKQPGKGWKTVMSFVDPTTLTIADYGSKAKGNVKYRLHYLGDATYAPTYSDVVTVTTLWNFKDTSACPNGHCHISGKLIPKTRHHKILVQVKHGSWKKYRVLHTSAKGSYKVGVTGSRNGTKYRIIIAGTKSIVATTKGYRVIRY